MNQPMAPAPATTDEESRAAQVGHAFQKAGLRERLQHLRGHGQHP